MSDISRRSVLTGAFALSTASAFPHIWVPGAVKPLVVSSSNGLTSKNGGAESCVERAFRLVTSGTDVLDSLIAGVNIVEDDPGDMSVGFGGLPNAEGVVQLDSCCMHGPKKWAGGVACIEGVKNPSKVAREVMAQTDHHLIVGAGAQAFAKALGMEVLPDLNTEASRKAWVEWKRRTDPGHYLDPAKRGGDGLQHALDMADEGWFDREHVYGTINCDGLAPNGDLAGVTTTSGLAFKIPGRVGDSPILGAGLYVDNEVGAAGSTGRGEANLYGLCSFLIVDEMRRGAHPKDAGLTALRRVAHNQEKRLLNDRNVPTFGLNFYIMNKAGEYAGVCLSGRSKFAVCDEKGPRLEDCVAAF